MRFTSQLLFLIFSIGLQLKLNAEDIATVVMLNNTVYTFLAKTDGFYAIDAQGVVMWCGSTHGMIKPGYSGPWSDAHACWKVASLPTVAATQRCKKVGRPIGYD
ncbi:unnamed protein product [Rotaria magnacalcarata]|uniref:Lectin n=1 Tax=Rotaria magnacalcarata TaxID=392030 RepID=A0A816N9Q7_9BILA|nr:unnamed protein product [Rotaria magnacalcarata]CAF1679476.1 unnamed protein product [Rotaria magnacalcarata]CAF2032990.1 unnamed protein product [Rotaria magnacalcarata]CAF3841283.1 unnamed protein product [Rotaria magnacalcarata]CAF4111933.1 unnamed protein product [Rotaria magnacalcarata]